ncbi:MAG: HAD family hydrolase [Puniceicoccaceae bacterium]
MFREPTSPDVLIELLRRRSGPLEPVPTGVSPSKTALSGIRRIAFDVYGTLFVSGVGDIGNSAPADRGGAIVRVLSEAGCGDPPAPAILEKEFLAAIRARQERSRSAGATHPEVEIREVWSDFIRRTAPDLAVSAALVEKAALAFELAVNPVWPMPGAADCLDRLRGSFGPFAIVSNAQFFTPLLFPALLDRTLRDLGFDEYACVWSYREGEAKPSPRLFRTLLDRLGGGFRPEEVLYIGNDRLNDVTAAAAGGLRTALFAGDRRSLRLREGDPRCEGIEPDLVLTSFADLPALLE